MSNWRQRVERTGAPLVAIIPLVIAVAGVPFIAGGEEYRKAYGYFSWILAIHWIFLLYVSWLLFRGPAETGQLTLPAVRAYQKTYGYLMVERLPWLGQDLIVSIYRVEDTFERFVCAAVVENIQENGLAAILPIGNEADEPLDSIVKNFDRSELSDILIKPGTRRSL